MREVLLGVLAVTCLAVGGWFWWGGNQDHQVIAALGMRSGLVLTAIWIAMPQLKQLRGKTPPWAPLVALILGVVAVARPKLLIIVVPLLLILGALRFVRWLFAPMPNNDRKKTRAGPNP